MNRNYLWDIFITSCILLIISESLFAQNNECTPLTYNTKTIMYENERKIRGQKIIKQGFCSITRLTQSIVQSICTEKQCTDLELHQANIKTTDEYAFHSSSQLIRISLYYNNIRSIATNTFDGLTNLVNLELGQNLLESIDEGWFKNLQNLKELHLQENYIRTVPYKMCRYLPKLEHLVLFLNELPEIDIDFLKSQCKNLSDIYLHHNPLTCDFEARLTRPLKKGLKLRRGVLSENGLIRFGAREAQECIKQPINQTTKNVIYPSSETTKNLNDNVNLNALLITSSVIIFLNGIVTAYLTLMFYKSGIFQ